MAVDKRHPQLGDGLTAADVWPGMLIEITTFNDKLTRFAVWQVQRLGRDTWRLHDHTGRRLLVPRDHPVQLVGWFDPPQS